MLDRYRMGVYDIFVPIPDRGIRKGEVFMEEQLTCCHDTEEQAVSCPRCRVKHRAPEETKALLNRLSRIEGQLRGIRGMVEKEAYCPDILTQAAAVSAAVNAFSRELLGSHIRTCVVQGVREGNEDTIDELLSVLQRFMK